jgi:hypothetical protein
VHSICGFFRQFLVREPERAHESLCLAPQDAIADWTESGPRSAKWLHAAMRLIEASAYDCSDQRRLSDGVGHLAPVWRTRGGRKNVRHPWVAAYRAATEGLFTEVSRTTEATAPSDDRRGC